VILEVTPSKVISGKAKSMPLRMVINRVKLDLKRRKGRGNFP
jgi:hypothetical protein